MLNRLYGWYGKRVVRIALCAVVLLVLIGIIVHFKSDAEVVSTEVEKKTLVTLETVADFSIKSQFAVVGTVSAVNEAKLQVEASGRVTSVPVSIGDTVGAGAILASMENGAERAQLLQAEGAYESALASSLQGEVGLDEAKIEVRNTYRDAFTTADSVVRNTIDDFFVNPGESTSGFRLTGGGSATEFNDTRRRIESLLNIGSEQIASNFSNLPEIEMLANAEYSITTISNLSIAIAQALNDEDLKKKYSDAELAAFKASIAGVRGSLDQTLASISNTRRSYEQAVISAEPGTVSQSSALLKSALGSLRAAQAQYEKTVVRTPISGVVNALYLKEGDYASMGQPAALVANNGSLEISTALGEKDLEHVAVGDKVTINNSTEGIVTKIAPAIDPISGKSEVKIAIPETVSLVNGSTVSISFNRKSATQENNSKLLVPLKALKMLASDTIAFSVNEQNELVAHPVVLGDILGDSVEITSGLTAESIIVTDARGLTAGDVVEVNQN